MRLRSPRVSKGANLNRALPNGRASDTEHGGTGRTRTVIGLIDNQVPHLSATVPEHLRLPISDCRFVVRRGAINRQSKIDDELGGPKGVEPSRAAVTVRCSAN